jgi:glycosyltransferase involved in cell wall biosynthesis
MKIALLKGNRFNPWHLQGFTRLRGNPEVTAFRAESQIQQHFNGRDDGSLQLKEERIYFDTQAGNPVSRIGNVFRERYRGRNPEILPFHERLKGFDVIQTWELFTDWTAEALEAKARYGIPVSVMVWDNVPFNMETNRRRIAIKRRAIKEADRFIVYTKRSRRTLVLEGVPEARIVHVDPGVDTTRFEPGPGDRAALGLDPDAFTIAFVGWLVPRKGLDYLLLALRELVNDPAFSGTKIQLLVVGSGAGMDRVERLVDRLAVRDQCVFAGSLPYSAMPNVYRSADVFALPSVASEQWQEQFGMSLIEAMACGKPVVASRSGAIDEVANGTAALCQPNDFFTLFEALKPLVMNRERRVELGAKGRDRVLEKFDLTRHASQLSDVYGELNGVAHAAE